jgi:hypothetical protein
MINAFEIWLRRRVLRTNWTERRTNQWVVQQAGEREGHGMLQKTKKRKIC